MNRLAPIFGILVLICLLAVLSKNINPGNEDEAKPPTPPAPVAQAKTADISGSLEPEITIGNPATAKYKIQMGWTYTERSQPDPSALMAAVGAVQKFASDRPEAVSAVIVDLDVPAEDLSAAGQSVTLPGISVNGDTVIANEPGSVTITSGQINTQLTSAVVKP